MPDIGNLPAGVDPLRALIVDQLELNNEREKWNQILIDALD